MDITFDNKDKCCCNCGYHINSCVRYIINPDLLKEPKDCGKPDTGYPHWIPSLFLTNMEQQAQNILYKHLGDKAVNDGESLYYLGGQEDNIMAAIKEFIKSDIAKEYWIQQLKPLFKSAFMHELDGLPYNTLIFETWFNYTFKKV